MSKYVTISEDLAEVLERRRQEDGLPSLDAAAEKAIRAGLREENLEPYTVDELRALIAEADASGSPEPWDAKAVRAEVRRRYAARKAG